MRGLHGQISRRDAALVAAALLIPIPVLAQSGLSVPLPSAVERSLGSLVTLDSNDQRTGTQTTGNASADNPDGQASGRASLRIHRPGGVAQLVEDETQMAADSSQTASDESVGDSDGGGETSTEGDPGEAGGGSDAGSPGEPASSDGPESPPSDSGSGSGGGSVASTAEPGLQVSAAGSGSSATVSVGTEGIGIDLGADEGGTAGDETGLEVDVTQPDGSSTGTGVTIPGIGTLAP